MITLGNVALLRPLWLLVLPALALLFLLTRPRSGALVGWQRATDRPLLDAMIARGAVSGSGPRWSPILLAVALGGLALSGPAIRAGDLDRLRNLDATLLVVDLSQDVADGAPLRAAATAAHEVLAGTGARQAGLVVYAGDAYVASGLSDDASAIDPLLFALDDKTVPDPGARPDLALVLARKVLGEARIISGDVVLISGGDGLAGDGARRAVAALRRAGQRVDTIKIAIPGDDHASAAHKAADLAALAALGGGASADAEAPEPVLAAIAARAIDHVGNSTIAAVGWRDLGRFLLGLAALPLLLAFRRVAP